MSLVVPSHRSGDMSALMDLLADPTKFQSRLDQLKKAEDAAKEQIALAGPASEIVNLRAEVDTLKAQAQEHEQHAREECERLIAEAGEQAKRIVADAQNEAGRLIEDANSVAAEAEDRRAQAQGERNAVERDRSALKARENELDAREQTLQQRAEDLAQERQSLEGDRARLVAARDAIELAL